MLNLAEFFKNYHVNFYKEILVIGCKQFLSAGQNDRKIRDRNQRQADLRDISKNIILYFFAHAKNVEADLRINEFQFELFPPMFLVPSN